MSRRELCGRDGWPAKRYAFLYLLSTAGYIFNRPGDYSNFAARDRRRFCRRSFVPDQCLADLDIALYIGRGDLQIQEHEDRITKWR